MYVYEYVYFLGNISEKILKIGYSKNNPEKRLKNLQTGNDRKLTLFKHIPGNRSIENLYHKALHKYHLNGDWFRLTPEVCMFCQLTSILDEIVDLSYDFKHTIINTDNYVFNYDYLDVDITKYM